MKQPKMGVMRAAFFMTTTLGISSGAWANSGGICDQARDAAHAASLSAAGCTCHGLGQPLPSTRLFVQGLPEGYVPGEAYDIQVVVLGAAAPAPRAAGFNLEPTGGTIESVDASTRICHTTECSVMQLEFGCLPGFPLNDCGVVVDPDCPSWDPDNSACTKCSPAGSGTCRSCGTTDVAPPQATQSSPGLFTWNLRWTAPPQGSGPVAFYLAGNVVNSDGGNGAVPPDIWSTLGSDPLQPVITVPEGGMPAGVLLPALSSH